MYQNILLTFGFCGLIIVFSYIRIGNQLTKQMELFPFVILFFSLYIVFTSFQYIDLSTNAYWLQRNDLTRYKMNFDVAKKYSLKEFFVVNRQEPLYTLAIYIFRNISSSFSFFLAVIYIIHLYCFIYFLKEFVRKYTYPVLFGFFSIYYTFFLQTFCLLRMGIAVSISLLVLGFLNKGQLKKAIIFAVIASFIHISAAFLFIIIYIWHIFVKHRKLFIPLYILFFFIGFFFAKLLPKILGIAGSRYALYIDTGANSLAIKTYLTNFVFILLILYKKKKFLNEKIALNSIVVLTTVYVLDMQMGLSIFYRMIFFLYPSLSIVSYEILAEYKITKKDYLVPLFAKIYVLFFWFLKLYKFKNSIWSDVGLDIYKIFYFN